MSNKLTRTEATDKASELQNLKERFEELVAEARDIMRGTGMIGRRAESYWINSIEGCLDDRGCMVTLQDTIDELEAEESDDIEEQDDEDRDDEND
jgi:hypothetical protein